MTTSKHTTPPPLPKINFANIRHESRMDKSLRLRRRAENSTAAKPAVKITHIPTPPLDADKKARLDAVMARILEGRTAA